MSSYKPLEKNMFTYYSITVPKLTIMSKHLINRKLLNELHHLCLMSSICFLQMLLSWYNKPNNPFIV